MTAADYFLQKKEKKSKDYAFLHQMNEKPSVYQAAQLFTETVGSAAFFQANLFVPVHVARIH